MNFCCNKQGGQFTLSKASLSQSPDDAIIVNNDGQRLNPCIDLYAPASSVVYDAAGEFVNVSYLIMTLLI